MLVPIELQEFSFVVDLIIKLILIQAVALSLVWFLRRASAAVKHLILSIAAISVLVLPAASLLIPQWNTGLLSYADIPGVTVPSVSPAEEPLEYTREDGAAGAEAGTDERAAATPADQSPAVQQGGIRLSGILVTIWIVGAAGVLVWLAGGILYTAWLGAQARNIGEGPLKGLFAEVAKRTGLKRHVALLESNTVRVPVVYGFLRQKFILPVQAKEWPRDRLEAIFIHELAHIGRYDNLIQFLAKLTLCIYWFNPLVWIIDRKLFLARECACDDLVIGKYIKAPDYAEHLMDASVELGTKPSPVWATAAMAEGTAFKDRILSILNPNIRRSTPKSLHALTIVIAAIVFLLPIAVLSAWESPDDWLPESPGVLSFNNGHPYDENQHSTHNSVAPAQEDDSSFNALLQALRVDDPNVREHAASALERLGDARAVPYLLEILNDPSADVREHVVSALESLADVRAVEPLCQTLLADTNAGVREHAASALGRLGDVRAVPYLLEVLNDPSENVREHVASALESLGDGRAVEPLCQTLLADTNAGVREHAASALGNLRDNRAFEPLLTAMQGDSDLNVREHAATALGMTGDSRAFQPLLETLQGNRNERIRAHAVHGLGFLQDERVLPILLDALGDRSAYVRAHAAMALGETRDSRALDALSAALNDPSDEVRRRAAESIEMIQGQRREN